ncbi:hypothetical protein AUJ14_05830 [Candidatus Micrarchaeota archaeon CG1_02_55_22]|nr:MAG: hypothetical protein AUJ14_05830 [Candidatus Micrarchaeota archaeon CG1_02_55_22]
MNAKFLVLAALAVMIVTTLAPAAHAVDSGFLYSTLGGYPSIGNASAPVLILAFQDFQAPYDARFATETYPQIYANYIVTGKARFGFINYPLTSMHPGAYEAARAGACLRGAYGTNGLFWQYYETVFKRYSDISSLSGGQIKPVLRQIALDLGVDAGSYDNCMQYSNYANETVNNNLDLVEGNLISNPRVTGTPTFFVIGPGPNYMHVDLVGAQPYSQFKNAIDSVTPSPTLSPSCNDSDGGFNYYVHGRTIYSQDNGWVDTNDICRYDMYGNSTYGDTSDVALFEYRCHDGKFDSETYYCPGGCSNGACQLPAQTEKLEFGVPWTFDDNITLELISVASPVSASNSLPTAFFELTDANGNRIDYFSMDQTSINYTKNGLFIDVIYVFAGSSSSYAIVMADSTSGAIVTPVLVSSCTDSDGGRNYLVQGRTITSKPTGWDDYSDICLRDKPGSSYGASESTLQNALFEYSCQNGQLASETYYCSYGCSNGACKPAPSITPESLSAYCKLSAPQTVFEGQTFPVTITYQDLPAAAKNNMLDVNYSSSSSFGTMSAYNCYGTSGSCTANVPATQLGNLVLSSIVSGVSCSTTTRVVSQDIPPMPEEYGRTLFPGWNLVPFDANGAVQLKLSPECHATDAWAYSHTDARYYALTTDGSYLKLAETPSTQESADSMHAAWLYTYNSCGYSLEKNDAPSSLNLIKGWNFVRVSNWMTNVYAVDAGCNLSSAYAFDASTQKWTKNLVGLDYSGTILLVKSDNSCTLHRPSPSVPSLPVE